MIKTGKIEQQLRLKTSRKKGRRIPLMTPGKTVYSERFPEYALSEEEIRQLQNCLLEMFLEFFNAIFTLTGETLSSEAISSFSNPFESR